MNPECYRLLLFRYIFAVAAGIYAYRQHRMRTLQGLTMMMAGLLYLLGIFYFGFEPPIFDYWKNTNLYATFFIAPTIIWILQKNRIKCRLVEVIGRASYHIFLTQMIYYAGYYTKICATINNRWSQLVLGVGICVVIGILFEAIDRLIIKNFVSEVQKRIANKKGCL